MGNKRITDYVQLTDTQDSDIFYILRGTGAGSDRYQTKEDFLQEIHSDLILIGSDTDDLSGNVLQVTGSAGFTVDIDVGGNVNITGYGESAKWFYDSAFPLENPANVEIYSGSGKLWEMSSPALISNLGDLPNFWNAERISSGFGKIFSNRDSWYFDGSDAYGILPTQLQNEDSIEFWIYPDWGASPSNNQYIIDNRQGNSLTDDHITLEYNILNVYRFRVRDSSGNEILINSSTIVDPNVKTHIKIAWSKSSNVAKLYVNGVDQGAGTTSGTGISNINMLARAGLTVSSLNATGFEAPNDVMLAWLTDFLIHGSYDISTTHYTAGVPYVAENRKMGVDTKFWIDDQGGFGAENGFFKNLFVGGGVRTDGVTLKTKVVEIGDWDMDTTTTVNVTHGLSDFKKIRSVKVIIRRDADDTYFELTRIGGVTNGNMQGGIGIINSTIIQLIRLTGGLFDDANYDSTSYNRGWVKIVYEV